jgi:hypothetical protein
MPDGAATQDLLNTWVIRDTISSNAEDWYEYARRRRGRDVKNGDIRVIVGVDKVSSWGIATSACNTGQTASYVFKHDPNHNYKWDCIGGGGRVGPHESELLGLIEDNTVPQNQCVFLRTINFTFSGKMWKNFPSEAVEELGPGSGSFDYPDLGSSSRGRSREGQGSTGTGSTSSQPGSTQSSFNCTPSVNFEPVELGVSHTTFINRLHLNVIQVKHPSAVLHKCLHEKVRNSALTEVYA